MTNRRYVNINEVSEYMSLPVKSLYELASQGRISSIKLGKRVLFDLQDIDKMMESMKRTCNKDEEIVNKYLEVFMVIDYNTADSVMQILSGFGKGGINAKRSNGIWHTCIRHNGKRIQKSLETSDRSLQRQLKLRLRLRLLRESIMISLSEATRLSSN
jgi:excisionase family DNA binding protein